MRTPEEAAREIECERSRDECITHSLDWPCNDSSVRYVAEAIRARDAEVAEQVRAEVRAETLAAMGGECEQCVYGSGYVMDGGACPCWIARTECRPGCTCAGDEP